VSSAGTGTDKHSSLTSSATAGNADGVVKPYIGGIRSMWPAEG
jgi:hypothetical protein